MASFRWLCLALILSVVYLGQTGVDGEEASASLLNATVDYTSELVALKTAKNAPFPSVNIDESKVRLLGKYQGCYKENIRKSNQHEKLFSGLSEIEQLSMTPQRCIALCSYAGYKLAGLQYSSECYCSNDELDDSKQAESDDECNFPCNGDEDHMCGGEWRLNVYTTEDAVRTKKKAFRDLDETDENDVRLIGLRMGCYADNQSYHLLHRTFSKLSEINSDVMTPQRCILLCSYAGYAYAGLEYGNQCYCDDELDEEQKIEDNEDTCRKECSGDERLSCGGKWQLTVYKTLNNAVSLRDESVYSNTQKSAKNMLNTFSSGFNELESSYTSAADNRAREKCIKNGASENIVEEVKNAQTQLDACLNNIANFTQLQEEVDLAKRTGNVDFVFRKYCKKIETLKSCGETYYKVLVPCLDESEKIVFRNLMDIYDGLIDFACYKDGQRLTRFVREGGPKCVTLKEQALESCYKTTVNKHAINALETGKDPINSFLMLGKEECLTFFELQDCVVGKMQKCKNQAPAEIAQSLFESVVNHTRCHGVQRKKTLGKRLPYP